MGMAASRLILDKNGDGCNPVDTPRKWGWQHPGRYSTQMGIEAHSFVSGVDRDVAVLICVEYRRGSCHPHLCRVSTQNGAIRISVKNRPGCCHAHLCRVSIGFLPSPHLCRVSTGFCHPHLCRVSTGMLPSPFASNIERMLPSQFVSSIVRNVAIRICAAY